MLTITGRTSFQRGIADHAQPRPRCGRRLRQLAQEVQPAGEVGRDREHDQQPDRLDRLHAEQVHLDAAANRARCPKSSSRAARPSASASGASTARRSGDASKSTSDAANEQHESAAIPVTNVDAVSVSRKRIAQRDHAHQADAGQRQQHGQHDRIVLAPAPSARKMGAPERAEEPEHRRAVSRLRIRRVSARRRAA